MSKGLVAVAMSGGIDSSVTAVKLKQEGYDVVGLTMKLWDLKDVDSEIKLASNCCSLEQFDDARRVCYKYEIPHYVLNMGEDFSRTVIEDFVDEYLAGRTPNPCVTCNNLVKWDILENKTKMLCCDYLATGHYVRLSHDKKTDRYQLRKGADTTRDQSYFLWGLKQESLARTLFPLGDLEKKEVRELGEQWNLPNVQREESREICFVPDDNYARLLREKRPELVSDGLIKDMEGNVVGRHEGFYNYTIGQRKKIDMDTTEKRYVIKIKPKQNEIIVGSNDDLLRGSFEVKDLNWVSVEPASDKIKAEIKIRYLHQPVTGEIKLLTKDRAIVKLSEKQRAITPGQSAVFYNGDLMLGGGRIV